MLSKVPHTGPISCGNSQPDEEFDENGARIMTKKAVQHSLRSSGSYFATPQFNTTLFLNGMQFSGIQGLEEYTAVKTLHLEANAIKRIEGLDHMAQLRALHLQSNNISRLEGLEACTQLEHLNITGNPVQQLTGLPTSITTLHASSIGLSDVQDFSRLTEMCPALQVLDLSRNRIPATALPALCKLQQLRVLYMKENPCTQAPSYRRTLVSSLPLLSYLDDSPVDDMERRGAEAWVVGGKEAEHAARMAWRDERRRALRRNMTTFAVERAQRRILRQLSGVVGADEQLSWVLQLLEGPMQRDTVQALVARIVGDSHTATIPAEALDDLRTGKYSRPAGAEPANRQDEVDGADQNTSAGAEECVVCSEELAEGADVMWLPCMHIFHQGCIRQWLTGFSSTCPTCRAPVLPAQSAQLPLSSPRQEAAAGHRQSDAASRSSSEPPDGAIQVLSPGEAPAADSSSDRREDAAAAPTALTASRLTATALLAELALLLPPTGSGATAATEAATAPGDSMGSGAGSEPARDSILGPPGAEAASPAPVAAAAAAVGPIQRPASTPPTALCTALSPSHPRPTGVAQASSTSPGTHDPVAAPAPGNGVLPGAPGRQSSPSSGGALTRGASDAEQEALSGCAGANNMQDPTYRHLQEMYRRNFGQKSRAAEALLGGWNTMKHSRSKQDAGALQAADGAGAGTGKVQDSCPLVGTVDDGVQAQGQRELAGPQREGSGAVAGAARNDSAGDIGSGDEREGAAGGEQSGRASVAGRSVPAASDAADASQMIAAATQTAPASASDCSRFQSHQQAAANNKLTAGNAPRSTAPTAKRDAPAFTSSPAMANKSLEAHLHLSPVQSVLRAVSSVMQQRHGTAPQPSHTPGLGNGGTTHLSSFSGSAEPRPVSSLSPATAVHPEPGFRAGSGYQAARDSRQPRAARSATLSVGHHLSASDAAPPESADPGDDPWALPAVAPTGVPYL